MKSEITALDLHYLIPELKIIEGAKIDKIFNKEEDPKDLLFQLHKTGVGKLLLRVKTPQTIFLTKKKYRTAQNPSQFPIFLRRWLKNTRVKEVVQKGFDRIIVLKIDKIRKNDNGETMVEELNLIIELISPGNIILTNKEGKIINLLQPQKHGERLLRGGAIYKPISPAYDPKQATIEELKEKIKSSDKESIIKTIAIDLSFSGTYAEEVMLASGVDKGKKPTELNDDELDKIVIEVKKALDKKKEPITIYNEERPISAHPYPIRVIKGVVKHEEDFSTAIEQLITYNEEEEEERALEKREKESKNKYEKIIKKQEELAKGLRKAEAENQEKGELIYQHYQLVDEILTSIKNARKKMGWDEIIKRTKDHPVIKKINPDKGEIIIELPPPKK